MKRIKLVLTTIAVLLCSVMANAHDFEVDGIFYNILSSTDLTVEVTCKGAYSNSYPDEYSGVVIIPSTITHEDKVYGVIGIGSSAFGYCRSLTSVTIPNSVTSIGGSAFWYCSSLISVSISNSITSIGNYAFNRCSSLTSVTIPTNVKIVGEEAFSSCESLASVTWNAKKCADFDFYDNIFTGCENITSLSFGDSVEHIPAYLCAERWAKNLTSLTIPERVTSIGYNAFSGCESITKTNYTGDIAGWCNIEFAYKSSNPISYSHNLYINEQEIKDLVIPDSVKSIWDYAFYGCSSLREIIIHNSVTDIGKYAFDECPNIRLLVIGTGLLSIGAGQSQPTKAVWLTNTPPSGHHYFGGTINYVPNEQYWFNQGPTSLPRYIYPYLSSMFEVDGIKYVPVSPSERTCDIIDCVYDSTMAQITVNPTVSYQGIEMTVKKIKPYAFYQNDYIKELSIANQGDIENSVFYQCKNIETLVVSNLGHIGKSAFAGCINLKTLIISNQGHIYSNAFSNCSNLKTATISNNGNIESQAFYNCVGLEQVDISNQGYIGTQAFYECTNLKIANINNAYKTDERSQSLENWTSTASNSGSRSTEYTFSTNDDALLSFDLLYWESGDDSYVKIILDDETILYKSIADDTLCDSYTYNLSHGEHTLKLLIYSWTAIAQLKVSNITIDYVGIRDKAFSNCSSLAKVTLGDNVGNLGNEVFYQCTSLQDITIPNSINSVGLYCFSGCSSMKSVFLGDGITSIKGHTFQDCIALENAKIGSRISSVNYYAFSGCSALKNIELGCSMESINNYAFENCSSLSNITIPQTVMSIDDNVFKGCASLADVIVEDRSTELILGSNGSLPLFADCPLDSVYLGGKIAYNTSKDSGYSPFYRNTSLRTVTITDQEDQIYENEFYGCTNLKNVTIGHGIQNIGNRAFSGCSSLDKFLFGSNVRSIGEETFSDCTKMTELTSYSVLPPVCGANALDDINKWSCVLKVPQNYKTAYQAADQWKEFFFIEDVVEVKKYAVTYIVDNEIFAIDSLAVGESIVPIAEPAKEGYTFSGWSSIPETMPAHDVTITGTFIANTYTITYMVDNEIFAIATIAYGDTIVPIAEPSREGYTFSGWSEIPETMPAEDVVIKGSFNVNYYALEYIVDNEPFATDSIAYGTIIELREEPIKEGYKFSGWSEAPETMPAHDVEIYGNFIFTSVTDVKVDSEQSQKVVEDNQLFIILPNGKTYNAIGQEL